MARTTREQKVIGEMNSISATEGKEKKARVEIELEPIVTVTCLDSDVTTSDISASVYVGISLELDGLHL